MLAKEFGDRVAELVSAVTNPDYEPGRDQHEQYREHVLASLDANPWARVIKASDFTDNGVGLIHTTGPRVAALAAKYAPLVPVLRELIARPDTPLSEDVKALIHSQLDRAQERFTAVLSRGWLSQGSCGRSSAFGYRDQGHLSAAAAPAQPEAVRRPTWLARKLGQVAVMAAVAASWAADELGQAIALRRRF